LPTILTVSPDGQFLACVHRPDVNNGEIQILDVATGQALKTFGLARYYATPRLEFSPDGKHLARTFYSIASRMEVWNVATGELVRTITPRKDFYFASDALFSPDGKRVVIAEMKAPRKHTDVHVWDVETGQAVSGFMAATELVMTFSPDGQRLAWTGDGHDTLISDAATGKEQLCLRGHSESINQLAFSHDGQLLASCSNDHTLRIWDVRANLPGRPE
jgi:WD40 repeat protein